MDVVEWRRLVTPFVDGRVTITQLQYFGLESQSVIGILFYLFSFT